MEDRIVYIGIDILKKPWSISIYGSGGHHTTFRQAPIPQLLKKYIDNRFQNAKVVCAYHATGNSSWIHRMLTSYNYQCLAFDPKAIHLLNNQSEDETLTLDSRTIGEALREGLIESIFEEQHPNSN